MKKYRGIISIVIVASIVFSFAGCSLGGTKFGPSALAKYAKDYGADLYEDGEDFHDGVEYMDDTGDLEDGVYIHAEGDDIRDAMEQTFIIGGFYDSSVKEATVFVVGDYGNTVCTFVSEVFESEDDAQDMYDELVEDFEEVKDYSGEDAEMDSFEEGGMVYTLINADSQYTHCSYGAYLKGDTLFIVFCYGDERDINNYVDDVCEALDVMAPSEL